jgi:hypothetical protein
VGEKQAQTLDLLERERVLEPPTLCLGIRFDPGPPAFYPNGHVSWIWRQFFGRRTSAVVRFHSSARLQFGYGAPDLMLVGALDV